MSSVLERRRENCNGLRIGANVLDCGSNEGKMATWRGLFWIVRLGQPHS
jgi:hypothetical protein